MKLSELLDGLPEVPGNLAKDPHIAGVTTDPNLCRQNFLYVAVECETVDSTRYGVRLDGRDYIDKAIANGAVAILTTSDVSQPELSAQLFVRHPDPLTILGPISSRFFGQPKPKNIALVTGTNGKTSTVNFCRMLWSSLNIASCSIGNLGGVCSDGTLIWDRDPALSVPETVALHEMLHGIAKRGFDHVAMECTSHALFDHRLNGLTANIGAFTNLTRDHLDFHMTMEEYFRVKMILFRNVIPPGGYAVLNADAPGPWYEQALNICKERKHQIISYGEKGNEVRLLSSSQNANGQLLGLEIFGERHERQLNLFGEFQASNALCALAIAIASGVPIGDAVSSIPKLSEVEGRLNIVATTASGGKIVVDYAHTPDGIRAALEACRTFTPGKLVVVFGCNGDRDPGKRPQMGEVAEHLADVVIVTDGHPRSEDPAKIRKEVMEGAPRAREIGNRAEAIEAAIRSLGSDDTVLLAGMGHERVQVVGDQPIPFSDTDTARRIVASIAQSLSD